MVFTAVKSGLNVPMIRAVQEAVRDEHTSFDMALWYFRERLNESLCKTFLCVGGHTIKLAIERRDLIAGIELTQDDKAFLFDVSYNYRTLNIDGCRTMEVAGKILGLNSLYSSGFELKNLFSAPSWVEPFKTDFHNLNTELDGKYHCEGRNSLEFCFDKAYCDLMRRRADVAIARLEHLINFGE